MTEMVFEDYFRLQLSLSVLSAVVYGVNRRKS